MGCSICRAAWPIPWFKNCGSLRRSAPIAGSVSIGTVPDRSFLETSLSPVVLVGHVLHPVDDLAVEMLLDGDVRHGCRRGRAVPMLFARLEPDHITWPDLLDGSALALHPAEARDDDQGLAERMRMPCGASTGFKRDAACGCAPCIVGGEQRIDPDSAGKPLGWTFSGWLGAISLDLHQSLLSGGA